MELALCTGVMLKQERAFPQTVAEVITSFENQGLLEDNTNNPKPTLDTYCHNCRATVSLTGMKEIEQKFSSQIFMSYALIKHLFNSDQLQYTNITDFARAEQHFK
jgi:hypothetical protein